MTRENFISENHCITLIHKYVLLYIPKPNNFHLNLPSADKLYYSDTLMPTLIIRSFEFISIFGLYRFGRVSEARV